jgi:hypothetical protein
VGQKGQTSEDKVEQMKKGLALSLSEQPGVEMQLSDTADGLVKIVKKAGEGEKPAQGVFSGLSADGKQVFLGANEIVDGDQLTTLCADIKAVQFVRNQAIGSSELRDHVVLFSLEVEPRDIQPAEKNLKRFGNVSDGNSECGCPVSVDF